MPVVHAAAGLRLHDLIRLVEEIGDESQGEGDRHGQLVDGETDEGKWVEKPFQGIGHFHGLGRGSEDVCHHQDENESEKDIRDIEDRGKMDFHAEEREKNHALRGGGAGQEDVQDQEEKDHHPEAL